MIHRKNNVITSELRGYFGDVRDETLYHGEAVGHPGGGRQRQPRVRRVLVADIKKSLWIFECVRRFIRRYYEGSVGGHSSARRALPYHYPY